MKNLEYSFKSYIGSQDRENSESCVCKDDLFMVVDGLGIESLAEIAKDQTCRIIPEAFFRHLTENNSPADALIYAVEEANKRLFEERHKFGEKIAASISLAYILGKIMYFTHLGDARIYSFQQGELNQLTKDHTVIEDDPLAEQKYDDPRALHALTQGLGIHEKPVVQVKKYPLDKICLIIMTTTGLTERVSNRDISWTSKKLKRPARILRALIDLDKRKGGSSDLTIGIIKCGGLTKYMWNRLMAYAICLLFITAVVWGYIHTYGTGGNDESDRVVVKQPIIQKNKTDADKGVIKDRAVKPTVQEKTEKPSVAKSPVSAADPFKNADDFINEWRSAWEKTAGAKGDIKTYISFYSDRFSSDGFDRASWRKDKDAKSKRKEWIKLGISNLKISGSSKDGRIEARFVLNYRSSNFNGTSKKVLGIVKEGNALKIISEKTY